MIELHKRHTAVNLKAEILKFFEEFNINIKQIYSITTDNGANMLKTVELMNSTSDLNLDIPQLEVENDEYFENILQG